MIGPVSQGPGGADQVPSRAADERADQHTGVLREATDRRLATLAGLGDRAAFEELFARHFAATVRFAVPMLDGDERLAEDAVQEAWIKAWKALPDFRGDSAVRTWLFSITARSAMDARRRRRPVPIDDRLLEARRDGTGPGAGEEPGARSPEDLYGDLELWQALQLALDELPWNQRACWVLREIDGRSYDEISSTLNLSTTVVRGQLHRARRALARRMEQWRR
ncbi:hypothetical protein LUZ63_021775 [Rhynchospora breviuscula]|uniref:Uncharacterized protein n=1 Tax=Rhynchospora breviuscula TaxID=2022672 RepID=A0A9Q0BYC1_9POAL|nr:hypothetical protein LUZ63_021775 [Rhynchospora breviuscula]